MRPTARGPYLRLAIMFVASFIVMFVIMYAQVTRWDHLIPNINKAYMALLMAAPMPLLSLAIMGTMFQLRLLNVTTVIISVLVTILVFVGIRQQAMVDDERFLESMIPHHSSAILMCEQASLQDAEIRDLCRSIVETQLEEIAQMQALRGRLSD